LPNGAIGLVDYAHNPSSCEAVLSLLNALTDHLIVVLGAGGERDRTKRPKMGAIAARYGHIFVLTSDNPRTEDPESIANDIFEGVAPRFTWQSGTVNLIVHWLFIRLIRYRVEAVSLQCLDVA